MFKSWHIFVFSLIPLALVLTGVIIGSIHFSGGDSQAEVLPTPAPRSLAPAFDMPGVFVVASTAVVDAPSLSGLS